MDNPIRNNLLRHNFGFRGPTRNYWVTCVVRNNSSLFESDVWNKALSSPELLVVEDAPIDRVLMADDCAGRSLWGNPFQQDHSATVNRGNNSGRVKHQS